MLGEDIEKNRAEYVSRLELDNVRLTAELAAYKKIAEQQEFTITFRQEISGENSYLVGVSEYNGKVFTVRMSADKVHYFKGDHDAVLDNFLSTALMQMVSPVIRERCIVQFKTVVDNMNNLFERGLIK